MNKPDAAVGEQKKAVTQRTRLQAKGSVGSLRQPTAKVSQTDKVTKIKPKLSTKAAGGKQSTPSQDGQLRDPADAHFISFDGLGSSMQPKILTKPVSVARFETTLKEPLRPSLETSRRSKLVARPSGKYSNLNF